MRVFMKKIKINPIKYIFEIIVFILLACFALILFSLILWGLLTSVKENMDYRNNILGLPIDWRFDNYLTVLKNFYVEVTRTVFEANSQYLIQKRVELPEILFNTVVYSVGGSFMSALCPCLVAYCVAKYDKWLISKIIYSYAY